jgi:hypothetical protein
MGEFAVGIFPGVDGYNLSYLKPEATLGVVSQDEYAAPFSAFWYRGLGRAAAITAEVDGQYSGAFGQWDEYPDFLITHARWLLGGETPEDVYLKMDRDGQDAVVTVELDPDRPGKITGDAPTLSILPPSDEREHVLDLPFQWTGPNSLQARFKLARTGTYRTLVKMGGRNIVRGPVITLPYSPEFMPRAGLPEGRKVLAAVSELTGGRERVDVLEAFADRPRSARMTSLLPWLFALAVILLLAEIAGRRLSLWSRLSDAFDAVLPAGERVDFPGGAARPSWSQRVRGRWASMTRRTSKRPATAPGISAASPLPPSPTVAASSAAPAAQVPAATSAEKIFEQAKRRARKRLNE